MRLAVVVLAAGCGFQQGSLEGGGSGRDAREVDADLGTCTDGIQNQGESGVDCGGPCTDCAGCTTHTLPPSFTVDADVGAGKFLTSPLWNCNAAGTTTIDSASGTASSTSCALGTLDASDDVPQLVAGPAVFVVRLRGLTIANGHTLKLVGNKPIVLLVAGNVIVDSGGMIDASASMGTPGPGGKLAGLCMDRAAGLGMPASSPGWGGGGGGFGTAGGHGCYDIVNGGAATGDAMLTPLRGGCGGGHGNGGVPAVGQIGGGGGGAVAITASGTIQIGGVGIANVVASGGGAPAFAGGGNGGGSGGAILLVAPTMAVLGASASLRAHGGSGSSGSSSGTNDAGRDGHATDNTAATDTSGVPGGGNNNDHGRTGGLMWVTSSTAMAIPGNMTTQQTGGRGGGGGGGGRIVLTTAATTTSCD